MRVHYLFRGTHETVLLCAKSPARFVGTRYRLLRNLYLYLLLVIPELWMFFDIFEQANPSRNSKQYPIVMTCKQKLAVMCWAHRNTFRVIINANTDGEVTRYNTQSNPRIDYRIGPVTVARCIIVATIHITVTPSSCSRIQPICLPPDR